MGNLYKSGYEYWKPTILHFHYHFHFHLHAAESEAPIFKDLVAKLGGVTHELHCGVDMVFVMVDCITQVAVKPSGSGDYFGFQSRSLIYFIVLMSI